MKNYVENTIAQVEAFKQLVVNGPFQMLNLLKFKERTADDRYSGAEQYQIYMKEAKPFLQKVHGKVLYSGVTKLGLIGPEDELEWDLVLIVEYASKKDFIQMIQSPGYPSELRKKALKDSRLILMQPARG